MKNFLYKFLTFVFILILIAGLGVLSYLYFRSTQIIGEKDTEIATLQSQVDAITDNVEILQDKLDKSQAKLTKISLYNDMHKYIYDVIVLHGGFVGLTDAEYEIGLTKAQATGDQTLIAAITNAWNNRDGQPMARFALVMLGIIDGIKSQTVQGD